MPGFFADGLECSVKVRYVRDDGGHAKGVPADFLCGFRNSFRHETIKIAVNAPDFTSGEARESYPAGSRGRRSSANALSFHGSCRRTARGEWLTSSPRCLNEATCCSERVAIFETPLTSPDKRGSCLAEAIGPAIQEEGRAFSTHRNRLNVRHE